MVTREAIVQAARGWLGTPYHHQASAKGVGCDCLGLIRGVWRELCGPEPEAMPAYTPDWGSATGSETLLAAAARHLEPLASAGAAREGDVLVFRMRDGGVAKHAGILVSTLSSRRKPGSTNAGTELEVLNSGLRRNDESRQPDESNRWRLVHAQEGLGVVEIELGRWWRRRAVAAFAFPGTV
jgi:NlpC/P60 family putative phage cell wall peptidase